MVALMHAIALPPAGAESVMPMNEQASSMVIVVLKAAYSAPPLKPSVE
jgi:hypothetical protein